LKQVVYSFVLLFLKSTLLLNRSKHNWQALTRLEHQGRRRVYWEVKNFFQGRLSSLRPSWLRAW